MPEGDLPLDRHHRAERVSRQDLHGAKDVGRRPEERVHQQERPPAAELLGILLFELRRFKILLSEGAHDPHAGQVLLQHG